MMYFVYDATTKPRLMACVKDLKFVRAFVFKRNAYYRTGRFFYTDAPLENNAIPQYCLTL